MRLARTQEGAPARAPPWRWACAKRVTCHCRATIQISVLDLRYPYPPPPVHGRHSPLRKPGWVEDSGGHVTLTAPLRLRPFCAVALATKITVYTLQC